MGLDDNILGNAVEWVRAHPGSSCAYFGSLVLAGCVGYGISKGLRLADIFEAGGSLLALAAGIGAQRRESHEYQLYLQIGELIEAQGFDNFVVTPRYREFARKYAKREGKMKEYESALVRLSAREASLNQ